LNFFIVFFMERQKYLFEVLKTRIPVQQRLVDVVEELLCISTDAAYKRIRGQKDLSFTELCALSQKFRLPLEEVFNYKSQQTAIVNYVPVNFADQEEYKGYLNRIVGVMSALKAAPNKEICLTAQDIPIFHFSKYPELTLFKLYVWNDVIIHKTISFREFCSEMDEYGVMPLFEKIHKTYLEIPSKEIWTHQTIDTILRLIEHYYEMGAFEDKEIVFSLLKQLESLMDTIKNFADNGYKSKIETPFMLYISPVDLENNFLLLKKENESLCMIKLYTINSISTTNEALCAETEKWIEDLISKSTLISKISVKERHRFFQTSKNKIDELTARIKTV